MADYNRAGRTAFTFTEPATPAASAIFLAAFAVLLLTPLADLRAEPNKDTSGGFVIGGLSDSPNDLSNRLPEDAQRNTQRESLFPVSPLVRLHDATDEGKQKLYDATNLRLGLAFTQLFQGITDAPPGGDSFGTVSDLDFFGTWEVLNQGEPTQGQFYFQFEGRWDYGTTSPATLGGSVGSIIGTANGFGPYSPTFLPLRNLYWEQGSKEAEWVYRVGKITPDAIFGTSKHISPNTAFLSNAATGPFSMGLPDSGLGIAGAYYFNDDVKMLAAVSDANADRQDWGDLGEGDLFTAVEIGARLFPLTEDAGFSKLAFWHSDGTSDGLAINASTGSSGWGFFAKHEQELTSDGKTIGLLRYGQSFDDSALYEQQASAQLLRYDPPDLIGINNDLVGAGYVWVEPSATGLRDEHAIELFYRFPAFPLVDTTLHYQAIINPALDPTNDLAHAFSLRLRTTF